MVELECISATASSAEETSLLISWRSGVVVMVRILETVDMGCIASQGAIVEHRRATVYLICAEGHPEGYAKRAKRGHV